MIDLPQHWLLSGLAAVLLGVTISSAVEFLARSLDQGRYSWQQALRRRLGVAPDKPLTELRWATRLLQLVIWASLGYALMRLWGLDELGASFLDTLLGTGIAVGGATVVPGKLILGTLAFFLLVTLTRWFKRKLERDWLPRTALEPSVRMSVATLFGYATFVVAVLVGLSAAGLDLSKVAIVAGALSVGIGFGLQNIVNNFVSGLILLFERPVRLGDYIKVGNSEGFVRRISIRSTELENADRISVMVPNSVLLSSELQNWNYRDSLGRVVIPVGVAYGSDAEQVRDLLLQIAMAHPMVIQDQERADVAGPSVLFMALADSCLSFELRANVRDIYTRTRVASDLHYAIYNTLREQGIEIPFPQQDVWLRNPSEPDGTLRAASAETGTTPAGELTNAG